MLQVDDVELEDDYIDEDYDDDDDDGETNSGILFVRRRPRFHRDTFTTNPVDRFVAAEIEVARAGNADGINRVTGRWGCSVVTDGSLPNDTGFEINTSPAAGDMLVAQLTAICQELARGNARVTTSCGLHVHADARDFDFDAVVRFLRVYARVEKGLLAVVPPERRTNGYCMPRGDKLKKVLAADTDALTKAIIVAGGEYHAESEAAKQRYLKDAKKYKDNGHRYSALNVHSWFHRGTFECRLHSGTTDRNKILYWAMLWGELVSVAKRMTDAEASSLPWGDEADSFDFLLRLAPTDEVRTHLVKRREKFAG